MEYKKNISKRIANLRQKYQKSITSISIQRANYYTKMWKQTEGQNISINERVALCLKHVFSNMSIFFDPDDNIAGNWTEYFFGIPIDIEKGVYNSTFEHELKTSTLILSQLKSTLKFLFSEIKNQGIFSIIKNIQKCLSAGVAIPNLGLETMDKRKVNPYKIDKKDKKILLRELLPFWKGKSVCDTVVNKLEENNIFAGNTKAYLDSIPGSFSGGYAVLSPSTILATVMANVVIDNTTVLKKGIIAMKEEILDVIKKDTQLKKEETEFLKSIVIIYDSILIFTQRLTTIIKERLDKEMDPSRKKNMKKILDALARVPAYPAASLFEAIQAYWIIKVTSELSLPFNGQGMGRLDQIFYPYYKRDIDKGAVSREEARELFEEILIKYMGFNVKPFPNYMKDFFHRFCGMEAVTIGGTDASGKDVTNELSYILLEAAYRSKTVINIVTRLHNNTPDKFYMMVSDILYNKVSNISFHNDAMCISAMQNAGYTLEDARVYSAIVCANFCAAGKTGGAGCSSISVCNLLDTTLRNGDNAIMMGKISNSGIKTGGIDSFKTFNELLDAFKKQIVYSLSLLRKGVTIRDNIFASQLPTPFISAFSPSTLIKRKDVTIGGDVYRIEYILLGNSVANLFDSLFVIKKLVFEKKAFTLNELISAIDNNFKGYEEIQSKILNLKPKWGNGNPEIDQFAREIINLFSDAMKSESISKNRIFVPSIGGGMAHTLAGRLGMATADGRKAGKPFAAGCSPYNVEKRGPTGVLRSISSLNLEPIMECSVNLKLHPSLIGKTSKTREKWISLLKTYFKMGGIQLQPTVVSAEDLKAAQNNPENYKDLIVKVGGYSVYFTELGIELQNEIISRTEHART